jgi:hypothetical protein
VPVKYVTLSKSALLTSQPIKEARFRLNVSTVGIQYWVKGEERIKSMVTYIHARERIVVISTVAAEQTVDSADSASR